MALRGKRKYIVEGISKAEAIIISLENKGFYGRLSEEENNLLLEKRRQVVSLYDCLKQFDENTRLAKMGIYK